MRHTALGFAVAMGLASTAHAADLTAFDPPAPTAEPAFSWSGLYLGAHAGHVWTDFNADATDAYGGSKLDGFFGGGQLGYNYHFANNLVLGIEADISLGDQKSDISVLLLGDEPGNSVALDYSTKLDAFGTVRARAGYAIDRFLPYVTGGLAWANARMEFHQVVTAEDFIAIDNRASDKQTFTGWTVGAGVEYAITDNVTAKAEYLYADLGSKDFDLGTPVPADVRMQTVKFGLNYRF